MAVAVAISVCNDNMDEYDSNKVKDEPKSGPLLDINHSIEKMSLTEPSPCDPNSAVVEATTIENVEKSGWNGYIPEKSVNSSTSQQVKISIHLGYLLQITRFEC